jgi:hypothetical protein
MKKYKSLFNEITESDIKKLDSKLDAYFKKLVPDSGSADTIEGEMIRAMSRILYRYYNDGDFFFRGYGKETVYPSVKYLNTSTPISSKLRSLFSKAQSEAPKKIPGSKRDGYVDQLGEKDMYLHYIYEAVKEVLKYVDSKKGNYEPNTEDSR